MSDFEMGGENRIRTGVNGFADRCLAPRPSRHLIWIAKVERFFDLAKKYEPFFLVFSKKSFNE